MVNFRQVYSVLSKGNGSAIEDVKRYPTQKINLETEGYLSDKVKKARELLTGKYATKGNMAYAEVHIDGIEKNDFYGHSKIYDVSKVPGAEDFSPQPSNPIFKATDELNSQGVAFPRDVDSEYKIINHIANRLGDNYSASGTIRLFTERDTCNSCNRIIKEFKEKYSNITIEVFYQDDLQ